MFSSIISAIKGKSSEEEDDLENLSVNSFISAPALGKSQSFNSEISNELVPTPQELALIDKIPSNFETTDIMQANPLISFENEMQNESEIISSSNFKEYASLSLNIEDPQIRRRMSSIQKNQINILENNVYTKELNQCDFQLTYMNSEYKKEYLRTETLKKLNQIIYEKEKPLLSWPNCISMNSSTLVVCGGSGNFIIFQKSNWIYESFQASSTLKKINCCEISEDSRSICIGDSQGSLGIFDLKKKKLLKFIQGQSDSSGILAIRIMHQVKKKMKNLQILTSDAKGVSKLTFLTKGMFKYSAEQTILLQESNQPPTQQISLFSEQLQKKYYKCRTQDRLVAFLSFQSVRIFSYSLLSLSIQQVFEFRNPEYNLQTFSFLDMKCMSLSIGEGYAVEISDYLYKTCTQVVSWKNCLYVIKSFPSSQEINQLKEKGNQIFQESNPLVFEKNIISVAFLAVSILIIIDEELKTFLVNMCDLKGMFISSISMKDICQNCGIQPFPLSAQEKSVTQMHKIASQASILIYSKVFCQSRDEDELIFTLDGKMGVTALTKWTSVYTRLIENGEWRQAMHYITSIYYGKDKFVTNLPSSKSERKKELEDSVKIVSSKYLQMCIPIFKPDVDKSYKKNLIGLVVEFLVLNDNFEFLFTELRIIVEEYLESKEIFVEILVPFIRKHKLKTIPSDTLIDLINFFQEKDHLELAEVMIIQLDSSQIDSHLLMELCIKKGLIRALIYICTSGGEDYYMTPLSKLWGHYLSQKYSTKNDDYHDTPLTKFFKCVASDECKGLGMRSLWYVKLCLKKHTITGEIIPISKFESLVVHIAEWIFNVNNLQELLMFSPTTTFEIINMFFSSSLSKIVNKNQLIVSKRQRSRVQSRISISSAPRSMNMSTNMSSSFSSFSDSGAIPTMLDEVLDAIFYAFDSLISLDGQPQVNLLISQISSSEQQFQGMEQQSISLIEQIKQEYYVFIAKLFLSDQKSESQDSTSDLDNSKDISSTLSDYERLFTIKKTLIFEVLLYFSANPSAITILSQTSVLDEEANKACEANQIEMKSTNIYCKMIQRAQLDQDQMITLNQAILQSFGFPCLQADIYASEKKFSKSFDCLLLSSNPLVQIYFFSWFPLLLKKLQEEKDTSSINMVEQLIETQLIKMIRIDAEKTRELIREHLSHMEARMIRTMSQFPDKQLEYIEHSLLERSTKSLPKDLLTLYIELLCSLRPKSLLTELQKYEYDLDACLAVVKRFNAREACAYLLEKQGNIQECFQYHMEFLNAYSSQLFNFENSLSQENMEEIIQCQEQEYNHDHNSSFFASMQGLETLVNSQFDKMYVLIKSCSSINGSEEEEKLLYCLLDSMVIITSKSKIFTNLAYENIGKLIIEAHSKTSIDTLISQIKSKYGHLKLEKLKKVFFQIFQDEDYTRQTYLNIEDLLQSYVGQTTSSLVQLLQSGLSNVSFCASCLKRNLKDKNNQSIILFKCGHLYHSSCYQEIKNFVQSKLSDKKSSILDQANCFSCISKNSFASSTLFSAENKQRILKDNMLQDVICSRLSKEQAISVQAPTDNQLTLIEAKKQKLSNFDLEKKKKYKAIDQAHENALNNI